MLLITSAYRPDYATMPEHMKSEMRVKMHNALEAANGTELLDSLTTSGVGWPD
jgi:hypothetical protein